LGDDLPGAAHRYGTGVTGASTGGRIPARPRDSPEFWRKFWKP